MPHHQRVVGDEALDGIARDQDKSLASLLRPGSLHVDIDHPNDAPRGAYDEVEQLELTA